MDAWLTQPRKLHARGAVAAVKSHDPNAAIVAALSGLDEAVQAVEQVSGHEVCDEAMLKAGCVLMHQAEQMAVQAETMIRQAFKPKAAAV